MVNDHALVGISRKSGHLADLFKGFCINDAEHMCLAIGTATVLHIKVFVEGIVYAVVNTWTQLESADDLVIFTIHQFNGIGIASVGDNKAVGLGEKSHVSGWPKPLIL